MHIVAVIIGIVLSLFLILWIPFNFIFPNFFSPKRLCITCGHSGKTKKKIAGSFGAELLLYCFFIIPGLIYSVWRHGNKKLMCASCNATEGLIPLDSPRAKDALAEKPRSAV